MLLLTLLFMLPLIGNAKAHWDLPEIIAFGLIVWLVNKLGLGERPTLICNIVAIFALILFVFIL